MNYKIIDIENWKRKKHFNFFRKTTYPHYNLSINADITNFFLYAKEKKISLFRALLYLACRSANELPEFRQRIQSENVVEYNTVSPSFTYMSENDELFGYCTVEYNPLWKEFDAEVALKLEEYKNKADMPQDAHRNDLLFITCIPWFSFTSFVHTFNLNPVDTIPRIAWGKFFESENKILLPLSVQAHHSLIDGVHIGKYFNKFQDYCSTPSLIFN